MHGEGGLAQTQAKEVRRKSSHETTQSNDEASIEGDADNVSNMSKAEKKGEGANL